MKKIAFVYPGQGSQVIGMGHIFYDNFQGARDVMHEVCDTLGQNLKDMMFEGPLDTLTLTENAQPALLCSSMMVQRVLEDESGQSIENLAHFVAGHSLGEYSALCAAHGFSLSDAALLVKVRGNAMQNAQPVGKGAMAAILGLSIEDVQTLVSHFQDKQNLCVVANDNCPGQVVISGHKNAIDSAMMQAKEMGAKRSILLPVSAAFHSPLIAAAVPIMEQALSGVDIASPLVPVIANVTASPLETQDILPNLVSQMTGQVRWRESVDYLSSQEVSLSVEIGPGKVLSTLIKRCDPSIETFSLETLADLDTVLDLYAKG